MKPLDKEQMDLLKVRPQLSEEQVNLLNDMSNDISSLMHKYTEFDLGADYHICQFCYERGAPITSVDMIGNGSGTIEHTSTCNGIKYLSLIQELIND